MFYQDIIKLADSKERDYRLYEEAFFLKDSVNLLIQVEKSDHLGFTTR